MYLPGSRRFGLVQRKHFPIAASAIAAPSIWPIRERIGVDHILLEVDYPHADSTWPDTQAFLADRLADLSVDEARRVTHLNAAELLSHPLPDHPIP